MEGMGSGGGVEGSGRGGGRIIIMNVSSLRVDGSISVRGGVPVSPGNPIGGAGSGGSIIIVADTILGSGAIRADGGDAQIPPSTLRWPAGGGGRISLEFRSLGLSLDSITARGGLFFDGQTALDYCLNGAAGTLVLHQHTDDPHPLYREVIVRCGVTRRFLYDVLFVTFSCVRV